MACCVKGGLTSNQQIFDAFSWAKKNKYYREDIFRIDFIKINRGNVIDIPYDELAKKISEKFKTKYHSDWKITSSKEGYAFVVNSKLKVIFHPLGIKYLLANIKIKL